MSGYGNVQCQRLVAWTLVTGQWQGYFGIVVIAIRRAVMLLRQSPINILRKASIRCLSWEIAIVSWLRVVLDYSTRLRGSIPPPYPLPSLPLLDSCFDFWIAEPQSRILNILRKFQLLPTWALRNFTNETNRFIIHKRPRETDAAGNRFMMVLTITIVYKQLGT